MILPGSTLLPRRIIQGAISPALQTQPCGVDLTLKRILKWTSPGTVDLDNSRRQTASTTEIAFLPRRSKTAHAASGTGSADDDDDTHLPQTSVKDDPSQRGLVVDLPYGSYLVEFNETVAVPLDAMGQVFVRSSLFRSGALISAGVVDSGYQGALGALLQVVNPHGLRLGVNARLAQLVFCRMSEAVEGYRGVYQGAKGLGSMHRDGVKE